LSCLVIKNDGAGDLILASGLIAEVSRRCGGDLDLVTREQNSELAGELEGVRRVFTVRRNKLGFFPAPLRFGVAVPRPPVRGDLETLTALAARRYDVAICLRRYVRQSTLLLMRATRARVKHCAWEFPTNVPRAVAARWSRGWWRYRPPGLVQHELSYLGGFLSTVFGEPVHAAPRLRCVEDARTVEPRPRSVALGIDGTSSRWPRERWLELGRLLLARGWELTLFGGGGARARADAEALLAAWGAGRSNVGKLDWRGTARALAGHAAFVGNDTGLAHMASLLVEPCVVVLGGGTFGHFFPWPEPRQHLVYRAMECFDCNWECLYPGRPCLEGITPEQVLAQLEAAVAGEASSRLSNADPTVVRHRFSWRQPPSHGGPPWVDFPRSATEA
jgi:ADP-heptose:LPS heptosyltransferase